MTLRSLKRLRKGSVVQTGIGKKAQVLAVSKIYGMAMIKYEGRMVWKKARQLT